MAAAFPTKREVILVTLLLTLVLLFSRSGDAQAQLPQPHGQHYNSSAVAHGILEKHTPQAFDTQLVWESSKVPETSIVSHVPGELCTS